MEAKASRQGLPRGAGDKTRPLQAAGAKTGGRHPGEHGRNWGVSLCTWTKARAGSQEQRTSSGTEGTGAVGLGAGVSRSKELRGPPRILMLQSGMWMEEPLAGKRGYGLGTLRVSAVGHRTAAQVEILVWSTARHCLPGLLWKLPLAPGPE